MKAGRASLRGVGGWGGGVQGSKGPRGGCKDQVWTPTTVLQPRLPSHGLHRLLSAIAVR